jgi:hypothetical protein
MNRTHWSAVSIATLVFAVPAFALEAPLLTLDDAAVLQVQRLATPKNTDYATKLTLYWENDGGWAKPLSDTDKHYTAGVGASISLQAPFVDKLLAAVPSFFNEFDPNRSDYAMGIVGSLNIYTPRDYTTSKPIFDDRPYAGWTYAGLFFQRADRFNKVPVYESLEVDAGILGPSSLAENAQTMIHHAFHYTMPQGWDNQIRDEPDFDIKYNRRWRLPIWSQDHFKPSFEILPEAGFTVGSLSDELHLGGVFRLGWNMPDDFGPGHLSNPADFTGRVPCICEDWLEDFFTKQNFYLFARPYGQFVARNALLQGGTWHDNDPVTVNPDPAFFGVEYGLSQRFAKHFEFTYAWTSQSHEFQGQHNWDTWGSVQLSFYTAW